MSSTWIAGLKERAHRLKTEVVALYLAARHPGTPWYAKVFLAAIVAYALSPIDLIPDFIPVLGLVDEIVLLPFAIALALKMVPEHVMSVCRARASQLQLSGSRMGRIGAAIIVLIWLALLVLAAMWAHNSFALERSAQPLFLSLSESSLNVPIALASKASLSSRASASQNAVDLPPCRTRPSAVTLSPTPAFMKPTLRSIVKTPPATP
jgi:uncharacterized membrane protein YkvA (DUF1232 family)